MWVGADVAIACKQGYVLSADSASTARCVEADTGAVYDNVGAECQAVCAPLPAVAHATISPSGEVRAGDTVHVVCDPGYVFADGAATFETSCVDGGLGGQFDQPAPQCVPAPVYCARPSIANAHVSPDADVVEGGTVTVECNEGFEFDDAVDSPFIATCVAGGEGASDNDEYLGAFDRSFPVCVPLIEEGGGQEVEMTGTQKMLYSECAKWRDNKNGNGGKPNLSLKGQLAQMAYCMQQDCMASMSASNYGCRYTDGNRLCYSLPGQLFCSEHVPHSKCNDLGAPAGDTSNWVGPGAWEPKTSVPVFGSAALLNPEPYTCYCFKNCVHASTSSSKRFQKYRCTGGSALMVGTKGDSGDPPLPAGAPTDRYKKILSTNKDGQCACGCGYVGTDTWEQGDAQ